MRRDVLDLRDFYSTPLGWATQSLIGRKLNEAWGEAAGLDVLGLGYPTPYLETYRPRARRSVAAMPAAQGVEVWPADGRVLACLADERCLPFATALFDRVLVVHALEEADDPLVLLREVWRVMSPAGRVIIVAANRRGVWSNAESTPFGHGRPFTRGQLERLVRDADLEPIAWSRALFAPPLQWTAQWAQGFEQIGARLWPVLSGVILLEAVKTTFAVAPRARRAPAHVFVPGALQPQPTPKTSKSGLLSGLGPQGLGRGGTKL